ncbi:MAG: hypothetical protein EPN21_06270 [Methylococcaceae bacterium]|nr:MAG: hypothetical protein EPN21_06270 [Methylococcaceae bacterium]
MTIPFSFSEILTLLLGFLGVLIAAGKLLFGQFERRMGERFTSIETTLATHIADESRAMTSLTQIERTVDKRIDEQSRRLGEIEARVISRADLDRMHDAFKTDVGELHEKFNAGNQDVIDRVHDVDTKLSELAGAYKINEQILRSIQTSLMRVHP